VRRQGFSLVTIKDDRTGNEILARQIDGWAREVAAQHLAVEPRVDDNIRW